MSDEEAKEFVVGHCRATPEAEMKFREALAERIQSDLGLPPELAKDLKFAGLDPASGPDRQVETLLNRSAVELMTPGAASYVNLPSAGATADIEKMRAEMNDQLRRAYVDFSVPAAIVVDGKPVGISGPIADLAPFLSDAGRESSHYNTAIPNVSWNEEPGDIVLANLLEMKKKWESQTGLQPLISKNDAEFLLDRICKMVDRGMCSPEAARTMIETMRRDYGIVVPIIASEAELRSMIDGGMMKEFSDEGAKEVSRLFSLPLRIVGEPSPGNYASAFLSDAGREAATCRHEILVVDTDNAPPIVVCESCRKHLAESEAIALRSPGELTNRFIPFTKASPSIQEQIKDIRENGRRSDNFGPSKFRHLYREWLAAKESEVATPTVVE